MRKLTIYLVIALLTTAIALAGTFTITFTTAQGQAFVEACAAGHCGPESYSATIPDPNDPESTVPNPESAADFAKRQVFQWMRGCVKAYRAQQADSYRQQAIQDAEAEMDGITVE